MAYSTAKVKCRLVLNSETELECIAAALSYELNSVPKATFTIALGRGHGSLTPAMIHTTGINFDVQQKIELYVTIDQIDGITQDLPTGEFRLFDGYLVGVSYQKVNGQIQAILHSKNWLLDMDYSSSLSDSSHPMNPSQFSYRTTHLFRGANSKASSAGASWTPFVNQGMITTSTIQSDFWKDGLYKWLQEVTTVDAINTDELSFLGQTGSNATAKKALDRFTFTGGKYVPLALDMGAADSDSVAAAIWHDVQADTFESFANTTLWGKLVGSFGSRYMFAVVPRVEDALVVPFIPGLQQQWTKQIQASDYAMIGSNSELSRKLRGVGIFSGMGGVSGSNGREPDGSPKRLGIGGWYSPQGVTDGTVLLKEGPRWLTNIIAYDRYSQFSTGGGTQPIGSAVHPGAGGNNQSATTKPPTPAALKKTSKSLLDAFAHSLYVYEQLRLRQIEVGGKFRLDIAPGSTVLTDIVGERFITNDALDKDLIGNIMRVTLLIDSENGKMGTNFNLSHMRTVDENTKPEYSVKQHPLWSENWPGCGLLARYD